MDLKVKEVISFFPFELSEKLKNHLDGNLQEIRVRLNKPVCIMKNSENIVLNDIITDKAAVERIFENVCENSVYAHQDEINQGYITVKGGNRVGVCGTAVSENGKIITIKNISSLNFRIANDFLGCSEKIFKNCSDNIIIAGPPASGKTTILRDIARRLSKQSKKVCIIDERFEIGGVSDEFDLGIMCDVLSGYKKAYGISLALRTLSPQFIVFDEIGTMQECDGVFESLNSGVNIITSVHCSGKNQFFKRPVCKRLIDSGAFDSIVFLGEHAGQIDEIYKINGDKLCVALGF